MIGKYCLIYRLQNPLGPVWSLSQVRDPALLRDLSLVLTVLGVAFTPMSFHEESLSGNSHISREGG